MKFASSLMPSLVRKQSKVLDYWLKLKYHIYGLKWLVRSSHLLSPFRLEIERAKAVDGYDDFKARNAKVEKELKQAETHLKDAYNDVQDLTARFNNVNNARSLAEKENDVSNY